jgi:BatD DUF11 like domain
MNLLKKYILIPIFFWIYLTTALLAQENPFLIEIGETNITLGTPFTVSVTLRNADLIPSIQFPDIKGFRKRGAPSRVINPVTIANKTVTNYIITQAYMALQEGVYELKTVEANINGQPLRHEAVTVSVGKSKTDTENPIEAISMMDSELSEAFLVVTVNKKTVFVGEGFNMRVSFLVAESNTTDLSFYGVETQLDGILKILKPTNCWEENFDIKGEIPTIDIEIQGKKYKEYRIYQASFFPLNNQTIRGEAVNWNMKIKENKTIANNKVNFRSFRSKPFVINVKDLPPHPLRNQIPVGEYRLEDELQDTKMTTGKNYKYDFKIVGEGNIMTISSPTIINKDIFEIYPPDQNASILNSDNKVSGQKTFSFQLIPQRSGNFELSNVFEWVYFNTKTGAYDTLRPQVAVAVVGQNITTTTPITEKDDFYDQYINQPSQQNVIDVEAIIKTLANVVLIAMLIGVIILIFKK